MELGKGHNQTYLHLKVKKKHNKDKELFYIDKTEILH